MGMIWISVIVVLASSAVEKIGVAAVALVVVVVDTAEVVVMDVTVTASV